MVAYEVLLIVLRLFLNANLHSRLRNSIQHEVKTTFETFKID